VLKDVSRYTTGDAVTHEMRSMFYVACILCSLSGLDISPELPLWARATSWSLQSPSADADATGGELSERLRQGATLRPTPQSRLRPGRHYTLPTNLDTTAVHPTWARYSVCLYWQSPAWARSVLPCAAQPTPKSSSSNTDAWPTARNSSGIMLWRRDMQRSV
jgi:hypothetical protein